MSVGIRGGTSGEVADVINEKLQVNLPADVDEAGYSGLAAVVDDGTVLDGGLRRSLDASDDYRLRVGTDRPLLNLTFESTSVPTGHVLQATSTMTIAQTGGYITLNSGASTTAAAHARIQTYRHFPLFGSYPLYCEWGFRLANELVANKTIEMGLFKASTNSAPTDGVFFRWNGAQLRGIINFNGSEVQTDDLAAHSPTTAAAHHALIVVSVDGVEFWVDQVLLATLPIPTSQPFPFAGNAQPFTARVYNAGSTPASAPQVNIGWITVSQGDMASDWPYPHVLAGLGQAAYQNQPGGAGGQTANFTNNGAPSNASLSNTAAGYSTLGGLYAFAAPAGAETDFALFAFQMPDGSVNFGARSLFITGIRIDSVNTGAAVATTETMLQWAVAIGATAVSLATSEGAAAKSPRRIPIGFQVFAIADPIGKQATPINVQFQTPLVVDPACYLHVIVRVPRGTATGSQVIRGLVAIDGYFA